MSTKAEQLAMASGEEPPIKPKQFLGVRHVQFVLLLIAVIVGYGMRTNMSVGILAMMQEVPPDPSIPTFPDWTHRSVILSSFFWGYVIPQVAAGQLVKNYGAKWFLAVAMFINGLFSLLIPVMAENFGEAGVIICRVIQGFSQGFLFPSVHNLIGKWTPLSERSTVASFIYAGGPLGTSISMVATGEISETTAGWPAVFYLYGAVGIAWVIMWIWLGANSPSEHKSISYDEKHFINSSCNANDNQKAIVTPWKEILTSLPFWAIFVSHCGQNWGFWTLQTEIPTYMDEILGYNLNDSSLLAALPYLVLFILNFGFSILADMCIARHYLSIGQTRKIFNTFGLILPALALAWLGYVDSSQRGLALTLLIVAVGLNSAIYSGFNVNHIDIAPNLAGTLMGITNGGSNIVSLLAPLAVGALGDDESDPILWRKVFLIAAGFYIVANCFFVIFGSGEVQKWNDGKKTEQTDIDKDQEK